MSVKNISIRGIQVNETDLNNAIRALYDKGLADQFDKNDVGAALIASGITQGSDKDFIRAAMRYLKQEGRIAYDAGKNGWHMTSFCKLNYLPKTQALSPIHNPANLPVTPKIFDHLQNGARISVSMLACFGLLGALILLNASFAWTLGSESLHLKIALVVALMALDIMRPLLVAVSFYLGGKKHFVKAGIALIVALMLSPVSVLSSTSILSSSFLLGSEMNSQKENANQTLETSRLEYQRLLDKAQKQKADWLNECARGGCGVIAARLEQNYRDTLEKAEIIFADIVVMTKSTGESSTMLARLVTTFEHLSLYGQQNPILLPIMLAITLEIAALFAPAFLLMRRGKI